MMSFQISIFHHFENSQKIAVLNRIKNYYALLPSVTQRLIWAKAFLGFIDTLKIKISSNGNAKKGAQHLLYPSRDTAARNKTSS